MKPNAHQVDSIDFADASVVKALNCALLKHYYGVVDWDIPDGFLCPPIPGRVDYIHYISDLIGGAENSPNETVRLLDIGTGANGIYSILANRVHGWKCTASDIDPVSIENVAKILSSNPSIAGDIDLRLQGDKGKIFGGIIGEGEYYDVSVCNPPFHASLEEALKGSQKKLKNLAANRNEKRVNVTSPTLNFGGQNAELWCAGGETRFLKRMIKESKVFADQCRWFTSLVSKGENVAPSIKLLRKLGATEVREIEMKQGNKITRVLAWTFVS